MCTWIHIDHYILLWENAIYFSETRLTFEISVKKWWRRMLQKNKTLPETWECFVKSRESTDDTTCLRESIADRLPWKNIPFSHNPSELSLTTHPEQREGVQADRHKTELSVRSDMVLIGKENRALFAQFLYNEDRSNGVSAYYQRNRVHRKENYRMPSNFQEKTASECMFLWKIPPPIWETSDKRSEDDIQE